MTATELLARFADPQVFHSLSTSDKLIAGLMTTILGMGITFLALIILQFVIVWMDRICNRKTTETTTAATLKKQSPATQQPREVEPETDSNELVAVIAATIATQLKTSIDNIMIKNIEKIDDRSPSWNRAGLIEQMNNRM